MLNCIIVDDEPLAREGMANYVRETGFLQLAGTCEDPVVLMQLLDEQKIDLLFLDIQMPKMSGIDFLKITPNPPMVIITTAFPSYALEGFQLNVLDYLLKPITFDRFLKSAAKAKDYFMLRSGNTAPEKTDHFFIRCGSKYEKIYFADILYVEGMQNYITIHTTKGKYITLLYLKHLEQNLDAQAFIRVHKSFIAAIGKIDSIEGNEICIGGHRVPMSRNYREQVIEKVVANRLWDKLRFS